MVDNEADETTTRIDGHISGPIEVILEDGKQTSIDKSMIYIHSSKSELVDNDDPLFVSIEISAACVAGGFFKTIITKDTGKFMFRKLSGIEEEDWYRVATHLFPVDESVLEANDVADDELQYKYQLSAKLQVHNNEDDEIVNDKLIVTIKTKARIPVTVGSIELEPIEIKDEEVDNDEHQEDLFDWLELTTFQNQSMISQIKQLNLTIDNLKLENFKLKNYYEQSKLDYESIITDLETKFYHVLNSKKDYIWKLIQEKNKTASGNDIHGGRIVGLNERFMEKQGKLQVIDQSKISNDLDEKFIRKRKEPAKRKVATNKRRKTKPTKDNDDDDDDDDDGGEEEEKEVGATNDFRDGNLTDEDENSKVKQDDYIEVKKENDSYKFNTSLEIKDDDSINSDKFKFTRSLRSDRQVVDDELESDKEENRDENDDDDEDNEYGNQEDNDNEILSHTEDEEEDEDAFEEEREEKSFEENDENKHLSKTISKNNSKKSKYLSDNEDETQAAITLSSNDVIDDSLPERQQHENEKNQEQETDYSESDVEKENQEDDNIQPTNPSKSQSQVETDYEDSDDD